MYFASSALALLAGFLLDVQKHKLFFILSESERYVHFTHNSEHILKTSFLYREALFNSWVGVLKINFNYLSSTYLLWKLETAPSGYQSGTPSKTLCLL